MTPKTAVADATPAMLIARWEGHGEKLAAIAGAFPENKYETALAKDARTFGEVVRHVAFWNQYVADSLRGKPADGSANELPKAKYATKAKMVEALKGSAAEAAAAMKQLGALDSKTAETVVSFLEHNAEHYGQLAAYCRLAGVVPPASRG